jgi:hypothetical protein
MVHYIHLLAMIRVADVCRRHVRKNAEIAILEASFLNLRNHERVHVHTSFYVRCVPFREILTI